MSGISSSIARTLLRRAPPGMSRIASSLKQTIRRLPPRAQPPGGDLARNIHAFILTDGVLFAYYQPAREREMTMELERVKALKEKATKELLAARNDLLLTKQALSNCEINGVSLF